MTARSWQWVRALLAVHLDADDNAVREEVSSLARWDGLRPGERRDATSRRAALEDLVARDERDALRSGDVRIDYRRRPGSGSETQR